VVLPATALVARRPLQPTAKQSAKYRQIAASVRAVGVIEPPTVFSDPNNPGSYIILDGHLRIEALRDAGAKEIECLLATVEEAFTYNKRINRIAAIQEHRMIVRAIERGASEERIAEALRRCHLDITAGGGGDLGDTLGTGTRKRRDRRRRRTAGRIEGRWWG
jgi:ParB-like chromosome segregation protein Spo0J